MNKLDIKETDRLVFDLELPQIEHNEQKLKQLKHQIADKYNVPLKNIVVNFIPQSIDKNGNKISLTDDVISNIQDPQFQQELIKEYIDINKIENVNIDDILEIDSIINGFVDYDSYGKHKNYKFKYVKWKNYLSYGNDNYFDFTQLHGLVLLNGYPENQCGKTTFAIDLLRFALFGRADKSPTLDSVFNAYLEEETEVIVEVCIEINDVDYIIRRTITRPPLKKRTAKSKAKQKVEYYRLINKEYELIENCEAESAIQTNNIIKETVGSVDDFNLVISATAYTLGDLLRMGQTDKSKLFSRWLGLLSLEDKDKITKDYYKTQVNPKLLSNQYNKKVLEREVIDFNTVIDDNKKQIKTLQLKQNECENTIAEVNDKKIKTLSLKREIKDNNNIDIKTIEYHLNNENNELTIKRSLLSAMKVEYNELKDVVFDIEQYNNRQKELGTLQIRNGELRGLIQSHKNEINRIEKLKEDKLCPNCGHPIDAEEQDSFISVIQNKIKDLTNEGVTNKSKIDVIQNIIAKLEEDRRNVEKLNNLKLKMSATKVVIDNIKLKIVDLQRQKQQCEDNKENIIYNNQIDNKISIFEEQLKVEHKIKEDCIRSIQQYETEIKQYTNEIKNRNDIIGQLTKEETIIRNWKLYQQLMGKNGIIKLVLKKALPIINNELKRLLDELCDFDVILNISQDNKVCMDLYRDGIKMDLGTCASGFEGTIASLALRCALGNISVIARPNLAVFDEILSGISADNMENIMKLFKRVLCNYDFILHICHDTNIVDYHDSIVTVTKKNNVSVIEYNG